MRPFLLLPALALASACTRSAEIDPSSVRLVDLTHSFNAATLYWPTSPRGFEQDQLAFGETPGGWFYSSYAFSAPEHGGTHLDAPIHFHRGGRTVDQIPLEQLVAPAVVIDLRAQAEADRDAVLGVDDVTTFERVHGTIPPGTLVLLRTGWERYWGDRLAYFGDDTPGDASKLHFPGFGVEAARLLVEERRVAGLGIDTPSIDHGPSTDFAAHRVLAAANGIGLENLRGLGDLPPRGASVIALPMKVEQGSGGPVRAIALLPR